jgi:anti-sigma regulatory factor (Ser/Thr protein kinase)
MGERRIELRAELGAIRDLGEAVAAFCAADGLPAGVADQLCLVLEELLTNFVRHGVDGVPPPDPPGFHNAVVHLARDGKDISVLFEDSGRPFDPLSLPNPDLHASVEDRPVGGLGVHLVRALMDDLAYARADGRNRLRMVKTVA